MAENNTKIIKAVKWGKSHEKKLKTHSYTCSRTELWSIFYNLTKSYKLEQWLDLLGISTGLPELWISRTKLNTITCSIGAPQVHLCVHMPTGSAGQSSGSVKLKLETHKHFFNRRSTGAALHTMCAVYLCNQSLGLPHKSLSLKVFFLIIFN